MSDDYTTVDGAMVGVLMGSKSDWPTMQASTEMLSQLGIAYECNVISAHRAPARLADYCKTAQPRGLKVLICAAGGAAHLAGAAAAQSQLPVLGCPMQGWSLDGMDSLLSTVQMPSGVPVATFAVGKAGAVNAALFAAAILGLSDNAIESKLKEFRAAQSAKVNRLE